MAVATCWNSALNDTKNSWAQGFESVPTLPKNAYGHKRTNTVVPDLSPSILFTQKFHVIFMEVSH